MDDSEVNEWEKQLCSPAFRPFHRMGEEFVRLSSFVAINKLGIDKIIKKHDKHAAVAFRDTQALLKNSFDSVIIF